MYGNEIKEIIKEYLRTEKAEYAVMVNGEWGSGKTYFLTHSLMEIIESADIGRNEKRKYAYVSLYGAKSIEEISKEIIFYCFGKKKKKHIETADTVIETASNILTASLGAVNIDLSKIKDTLAKINIRNWIICFDDLERCSLPINEILGFINRLVEHNHCKVIILANEKEIGTINLSQKLEEKYQVVLTGKELEIEKQKQNNANTKLDIEKLKKITKELFNEDMIYKSIREKVVGLTVIYEPNMYDAFDSIVVDFNIAGNFRTYLADNKQKIIKYFEDEECKNLRTLIAVICYLQKIHSKMLEYNYHTINYCEQIMDEFLKYIVQFTIYYRQGGKVSDLNLTADMGAVPLGKNIFSNTRGFKFLEKYCTTLNFGDSEFTRMVTILRMEKEEEEKKIKKMKVGLGRAYGELSYWWKMEDEEVNNSIVLLKQEIKEDKYTFYDYQSIIGQFIMLKKVGFNVGDLEEVIDNMNENIYKADEEVEIERFGYTFKDNIELQQKYDYYIDKLKLTAGHKNHKLKANEIMECFETANWANELQGYCEQHRDEFLLRYGFIDLIDLNTFFEKIQIASTKEIYTVRDIFKIVYKVSNINEFFARDKEKLVEFKDMLEAMAVSGINKPNAKKSLIEYTEDIIKRLEKEIYTT